jgi:hypothetical protein
MHVMLSILTECNSEVIIIYTYEVSNLKTCFYNILSLLKDKSKFLSNPCLGIIDKTSQEIHIF